MSTTPTTVPMAAHEALRVKQKVADITTRRHPAFNLLEGHWRFLTESYEGGPGYLFRGVQKSVPAGHYSSLLGMYDQNLFKYFKEGENEFRDRMMLANRKNYSKKLVDQIRSFVARKPATRKHESADETTRAFWDNADGQGRSMDRVMMMVLQWAMVDGIVWIQVDKPSSGFSTFADELDGGLPTIRLWFPFDVLDASFDQRGQLNWILVREQTSRTR